MPPRSAARRTSLAPQPDLPPARSSRGRYLAYLERRASKSPAPDKPEKPAKKRHRSFFRLLREFWGLLRGRRRIVILSICTVAISTLIGLAPPATTKIALDFVLKPEPGPEGLRRWLGLPAWIALPQDRFALLWLVGAVLIGLSLLSIVFGTWGRSRMTRLTKQLQAAVRRKVFDHAVRLPLHRIHQIKSGGVASILREDAGGAAELLFSLLYNPFRAIVQLFGTLIILALVDWRLLIGALFIIPAAYLSQKTWISRIRPVFTDIRNTRQSIDAHATEAFGGMRVVRGFSRERGEAARFVRANHLMARQELLAWWWSRTIEIIWLILLPAGSVAVLLYGGREVIKGTITVGDLMMFSFYLVMLLGPLESLTNSATSIQNQLAGFDRVLDLLSEPTELHEEPSALDLSVPRSLDAFVPAHITLSHVSFHYPGHTQLVLEDVNLDVQPGKTVALVGRSGAGKTTLCNLVARFYDPTGGAIYLNGIDIRTIGVDAYRRRLGIVEQDVFLFDGTVAENIGYARRDATPEDIRDAAQNANADGFIQALEKGYQTIIGERGVRLSGGQKQRIAIARALLADPGILILDEATSNLDSESESLIQQSLARLMRSRTCFVIAHRLSTIRHADLIVVLEQGRIIETGRHEELIAREGRYWEMLKIQLHQSDLKPV